MRYDISFETADFSGAKLYFEPDSNRGDFVEFHAAGVTFYSDSGFPFAGGSRRVYVPSAATVVRIYGVFAGRMSVTPFNESADEGIFRDETGAFMIPNLRNNADGTLATVEKAWGDVPEQGDPTARFYCLLDNPCGVVDLEFYAGRCRVSFETDSCIPHEEYLKDPWRYLKQLYSSCKTVT